MALKLKEQSKDILLFEGFDQVLHDDGFELQRIQDLFIRNPAAVVIIDLSRATAIDSTILGLLVAFRGNARRMSASFKIQVNSDILSLFKKAGMAGEFTLISE